ncbi:MAG: ferritin-like domain-containing protein [Trueperaceae bacterium]|nr:ferritin-like domain-containing protein [Trueperaceae bacterium]
MNVQKLFETKVDRRRVLGNLGMMGAGAMLTACGGVFAEDPKTGKDYDAAILNFALNLEYLEAAFYLAVVGRLHELPGYDPAKVILPSGYDGTDPSKSLFPDKGPVADPIAEYAQEIAQDELAHVQFLIAGLGSGAASLPKLDLDASFKAAAAAASGLTMNGFPFDPADFDPFANGAFFLHGAFIFEDVGVTAYKGAARYLKNPDFLEAAAGILAVEAYHAGLVRTFLYAADKRRGDSFGGLDTWTIVRAISDARDSLDQGNASMNTDLDQGIVGNDDLDTLVHEGDDGLGANIVPTDSNGIAFSRTPKQVANIVYLSPTTQAGGFFPEGITIPSGLEDDFAFLLSL